MRASFLYIAAVVSLSAGITSCVKKELPMPKHVTSNPTPTTPTDTTAGNTGSHPGSLITSTVNMESNYKYQVYYDLKTNKVVGQNLKTSWDLGFETTPSGYHVIVNSAKSMYAYNSGKTDFASVSKADTNGFAANKKWENPMGSMDSTAIGDWRGKEQVYIIDKGFDESGIAQGIEKLQILSVNETSYTVYFGKLNETTGTTVTISKDSTYNFAFLSFTSGQTVMVEPPKKDWSVVFTQYTHVFYDLATPYLVTGCILNHYQTSAYSDKTVAFSTFAYSNIVSSKLSPVINAIGYDWKTYAGSSYTTNPNIVYVIKDVNGNSYKLHFLDFYDAAGKKGNPKWEYQQL